MSLVEELRREGNWLFGKRGHLPLVVLIASLPYLVNFTAMPRHHTLDLIWTFMALSVSLSGLALRVFTIGYVPAGTSGRNTRKQKAAQLNTTGTYSIVRHPLYLGNSIIWLGVSLFFRAPTLSIIVILVCWLYHERIIMAEEAFLEKQFGDEFRSWAERTPVFIPKLTGWQPWEAEFSGRTACQREYLGFFSIISTFVLLEILESLFAVHKIVLDPIWILLWSFGFAVFLVVRILKKHSNLLRVSGR